VENQSQQREQPYSGLNETRKTKDCGAKDEAKEPLEHPMKNHRKLEKRRKQWEHAQKGKLHRVFRMNQCDLDEEFEKALQESKAAHVPVLALDVTIASIDEVLRLNSQKTRFLGCNLCSCFRSHSTSCAGRNSISWLRELRS